MDIIDEAQSQLVIKSFNIEIGLWRLKVEQLQAELQQVKEENERQCKWTPDEDGIYDAGCGGRFELMESGPKDNQMKYCPYCGGKLIEQRPQRR